MRIKLPKFTLIGATTKFSHLSSPLRDRFGHILRLDFYSGEEIEKIIHRSAGILSYNVDPEACKKIALCARRTPRVANRLLKRVRDFAEMEAVERDAVRSGLAAGGVAEGSEIEKSKILSVEESVSPFQHVIRRITLQLTEKALQALGIDPIGLDHTDINLLRTIIEKFQGGPVGLNTLSAATGEDSGTIEDVYEPFLIQLGMLERKSRGRIATTHAYTHLGLEPKNASKQSTLL